MCQFHRQSSSPERGLVTSQRYRELVSRAAELRRHFLPKRFDPTGTYSSRVHDRVRAYRLLAHAEVESYLEDRVGATVDLAYNQWVATGKIRPCLLALLAYEEDPRMSPTSILNPPQRAAPDLEARVKRAKNTFNHYVRTKNNGVKEGNVLRLLLPVGIKESQISSSWLSTLDSWGAIRGLLAHNAKKTQAPLDPLSELQALTLILSGLKDIDEALATV
jgi:hypothetical protein